MKDKLTKHGKKTSYFYARKVLIISLVALVVAASFAIPLGVTFGFIHL